MRLVTMISLGVSAVLGVAALVVAKTSMPVGAASALSAAPPPGSRPVVVAARGIAFGAKLDASQLTIVQLPPGAAPEGAFSTIAAALSQDGGGAPVALTPIAAREPILPAKLSGPGARPSVAAEIAEGMRAYTIKVTDVSGVGGHALPGDRVDVVLMRDLAEDGGGDVARNLVSEVVLQNVRVLGVDLNADPTSNKPARPSTATLEMSVKDAQKLAVASDLGELSMALRRQGAADIEAVEPVRLGDFSSAARRAPGPPANAGVRRSVPAPARTPLIIIVEGDGADSKSGA